MRRLLIACLISAFVLAGCGSDDSTSLDEVKVSGGKSPTVSNAKLSVDSTESKVVKEGTDEKIQEGDAIELNYLAVNGRTGKTFDSSYKTGTPLSTTLSEGQVLPGFIKGLTGVNVGSRVLVAISPKDGFGQANEQLGLKADDTMVFLFDIVSKVPQTAEGESKDLPGELPELTLEDDKPSKFVASDDTGDAPADMSVNTVIQGTGKTVEKGQTLTIQYLGQVYPDGAIFDESWSTGPRQFQIGAGSLIKCWDEGLVGEQLGSRVVLVCPSDVAYGDEGSGEQIKGGDTLIFSVDLLAAF